jgi:hypothetical protein
MHSCTIPQWVKLSEGWPKFRFFDFHLRLKNVAVGPKESFQGNENVSFMTVWFDLSPVQATKQGVLLAAGKKVLCIQITVVTLLIIFYGDNLIY